MNFLKKFKKLTKRTGIIIGKGLIVIYQNTLSPFLYTSCRFDPSCSEYTRQAIEKYGLPRGVQKGLNRIVRCHPFYKSSIKHKIYDPL